MLFDWGNTLMLEEGGPSGVPMGLWPELRTVDGAVALLADLTGRHRIGVATNAAVSDRPMIERALARASLLDHVSEIFCHRELGTRKAEPAFWDAVIARLAVARDRVVMVGDDLAQDVHGPRACGIAAVWFNRERAAVPAGLAAPVIVRLAELPALLASGAWSL